MKWPEKRIGDLTEVLSGFAFDSQFFNNEMGFKLIRIRDVVRGFSETFYNGKFEDRYVVKEGDFLIGMDGEFNIAKWGNEPALLNQRVCKITVKNNLLDEKYLFHFLPKQLKLIEDITPFVTVKHLSVKKINEIKIPLPPLAEQQRIAAVLDTAECILKQRETAIAKLDQLAQSVYVDMFGDSIKNQKNWKMERLSSLIKSGDSINYGVIQPGSDFENGIPLIRAGDVGNSNLNLSKLKKINPAIEASYKRSRLVGDEILVSCVGLIGAVMLADKSMSGFNIARAVARISPSSNVNRIYLSEYLKTSKVQHYFINELRTVAQPTLNIKQICETEVLCPPISLQNEFEKIINKFDLIRLEYKKSIEKQMALISSLQHQSFAVN